MTLGSIVVVGRSRMAAAQPLATTYPQPGKAIRLLIGVAQGGALDLQARTIAQKVAEQTGATVTVENMPGQHLITSAREVIDAAPDGYTLLFGPSTIFAQNPHTLAHVPYDPLKDFTPITVATRGPLVLTSHPSIPVTTVRELVAWAKEHPGKLVFGSFGVGTSSHVYAEAFGRIAGIEIVHVAYDGGAEATRDLFEGRIHAYFDAAPTAIANARTGKIRLLGVAASERNRFIPDVPTIAEQGVPGLDLATFVVIVGPAKMEPRLVAMVNEIFVRALSTQSVTDAVATGGYETAPTTPKQAQVEIRLAYDRWGEMISRIGFQKQ
ncbi:MAG: tripartite tricarboxylate transporter substrate binding protein [Burkholderiaceae bacterium]